MVVVVVVVVAGTPVSSLTWFVDGQLWAGDNAPSLVRAGHVKKMLQMERVARHYSGKSLTCQSSNSRLTSPKNVSLTLRLNRKSPLGWYSNVSLAFVNDPPGLVNAQSSTILTNLFDLHLSVFKSVP